MNISVVIPTLNEEKGLRTLLGILSEGAPFEIIVSDGGSTDATQQIAESLGATFLASPKKGRAHQLNFGAAQAKGDVLFFVHADTFPPKEYATDLQKMIEKGYDAGCYRSSFRDNTGSMNFNAFCTRFPFLIFRGGDQTLFVTKKLFEKVGGYDEYFVVMEDYEIIRTLRKHARFGIIPKNVSISMRKYDHNSFAQVNLANAIVFFLYILKVEPEKLWKLYTGLIRHPKAE